MKSICMEDYVMEIIIILAAIVLAALYFRSKGRHLDRMNNNYKKSSEE